MKIAVFYHCVHLMETIWYYWRRKWQSTPALLPGKSHGRRSLRGYSPWGRKESDIFFIHSSIDGHWGCFHILAIVKNAVLCLATQSYLTLCDPMDCSLPGSSVHGDSLGKNNWSGLPFPSPRGSSQPRDGTQVSHIAGKFFTIWTTKKLDYLKWHI